MVGSPGSGSFASIIPPQLGLTQRLERDKSCRSVVIMSVLDFHGYL
jgi:hypothetical protein